MALIYCFSFSLYEFLTCERNEKGGRAVKKYRSQKVNTENVTNDLDENRVIKKFC